jgi:hypothetical protein
VSSQFSLWAKSFRSWVLFGHTPLFVSLNLVLVL